MARGKHRRARDADQERTSGAPGGELQRQAPGSIVGERASRSPEPYQELLVETATSGPLPPPAALARYNEIIPNGAERIMVMAESQVEHRHEMESIYVRNQTMTERRGQMMAFALAALAIVLGAGLVFTDHSGEGFATIVTAIAALIGVNVFSRIQEAREAERRRLEDAPSG